MRRLYTLLLLLFVTSTSLAQQGPDTTAADDFYMLSVEDLLNLKVVTASKNSQGASSAPATIFVVTSEQIKTRGYSNLEEVLDDIPEIEIQHKSAAEYSNYVSFRGIAGNEKFIIMIDGIRVNSATGTPHAVTNNYPVANAKQIEVILGPASALYGVDAFTGIVNIITYSGFENRGVNVNASYGNYNTTDNSFVAGVGNEDISFTLDGKFYHSDEPFLPGTYGDDFAWYNEYYKDSGLVRLAPFLPDVIIPVETIDPYATPSSAYAVHGKLQVKDFEIGYFRNYESHNSSTGTLPEYNIYAADAVYNSAIESMYAQHQFTSKSKKWGLQSQLSRGTYELLPESKFKNTFTSYRDGYKIESSKTVKIQEQFNWSIGENSSLIAGVSYEDIYSLPKSGDLPFEFERGISPSLQNLHYLGTNIEDQNGNDLSIYQDFYFLEYQNYGSFLQYQVVLAEKLGITLGGRYDNNTRYGSSVNPRAGIVYSPTNKVVVKLLYGEAFLAPSPYKAYQHYGSFVPTTDSTGGVTGLFGPFWHLPNPDLEAEKLRSYEGSVRFLAGSNFALTVNGYYNDVSNIIQNELFFGEEFKGVPVGAVERAVNKGSATTYGGTVRVDAKSNLGTGTLNYYMAYSYSDGKLDENPIPYTSQSTVKGGIDGIFGHFRFSPRVTYRSGSYHSTNTDTLGNLYQSEAFVLVNLNLRYDVFDSDKMSIAIYTKFTNLLNAQYYNVSFGLDESFNGTPQDPIRLTFGIDARIK
jgi:outer membrane receptor for ferrienterochelin and colicin